MTAKNTLAPLKMSITINLIQRFTETPKVRNIIPVTSPNKLITNTDNGLANSPGLLGFHSSSLESGALKVGFGSFVSTGGAKFPTFIFAASILGSGVRSGPLDFAIGSCVLKGLLDGCSTG